MLLLLIMEENVGSADTTVILQVKLIRYSNLLLFSNVWCVYLSIFYVVSQNQPPCRVYCDQPQMLWRVL